LNGGLTQGNNKVEVRPAEERELDQLAQLWYDGWQDAHARIVPTELTQLRTFESFRDRLRAMLPDVRVIGPVGAAVGFCAIKGDELYQLFVAAEGRGKGVAAVLIADGEARLAANGTETAWLACSVGNYRAARFYEKCGWRLADTVTIPVETYQGPFMLEVWRYEKPVSQPD
jgi:GNAT superfamily N-acetyltransferase